MEVPVRLSALTGDQALWNANDSTFTSASINRFYNRSANRFMAYLCLTFLAGIATLLALEAYGLLFQTQPSPITFRGVYAWETAINFGLCHFLVDEVSYRLGTLWVGFRSRTVGRSWLVWTIAFFVFMILQRTIIFERTAYYHPTIVQFYSRFPDARPDFISMTLYCLPFWLLITTLTRQLIITAESRSQYSIDENCQFQTSKRNSVKPGSQTLSANPPVLFPSADLMLKCGGQQIRIAPETITYITVEDHYCRFFLSFNETKKQVMSLTPLKAIVKQLPPDKFAQIHRSHVIRLDAVRKLVRKGRTYYVSIGLGDDLIPISRQRQSRYLTVIREQLAKIDDETTQET